MAIVERSLGGITSFTNWLRDTSVPYYFSSVERDNTVITCKDANDNILLQITMSSTSDGCPLSKIEAWSSDVYSKSLTYSDSSGVVYLDSSFTVTCDGGILIFFGKNSTDRSYNAPILITKTNLGKTAVVFSSSSATSVVSANARYTNITSIAWGDAEGDKPLTFSKSEQNQTQFVPFTTFSNPGEVSYTPNAYYMPVGEYYDLTHGKFISGDYTYITNGYWAVKDAPIQFDV